MLRGIVALGSRIALAALYCHWAIIGGVLIGGGSLPLAAWYTAMVAIPSSLLVAGAIALAYRKDRLASWNAWVEEGATRHSMLILLAAIVSGMGGILLLQHGEDPEAAVAWVLNLSTLVGVLETATIIMALTRRTKNPAEGSSP